MDDVIPEEIGLLGVRLQHENIPNARVVRYLGARHGVTLVLCNDLLLNVTSYSL